MAKQKVSIYLIKQGFTTDDVFDLNDQLVERKVLNDGSLVLTKVSKPHQPKWVDYFEGQVDNLTLLSSSASALHLVSVVMNNGLERLFAISFGYGYTLINKETIEERFGLKVALNQAVNGGLRKLRRTAVSGNARKTDEQMPLPSSVDAFEIDVERDLLEGVTVNGGDGLLATGSIAGSDSLSLSIDKTEQSICDFLKDVYAEYQLDSYKTKYAWVDRIAPVRSHSLQELLNDKAIRLINEHDQNIWLAVPDVLQWEAVAGFRIGNRHDLVEDVRIDAVFPEDGDLPQSYEDLHAARISVVNQAGGTVVNNWHGSECLYGEIEYQGNSYCANNGRWYRIDAGYKSSIESEYEKIPLYDERLPDYRAGEREGPYNQRVVEASPDSKFLLDKKTVYYGGRSSQVELCDVLREDGSFIHVKRYSGSAALSHLFNQGYVSAKLIKADPDFRAAAQKIVDHVVLSDFNLGKDCVKRVVFAIISKYGGDRPEIPFFSKVALDAVRSQLAAMDIPVSITRIREVSADGE